MFYPTVGPEQIQGQWNETHEAMSQNAYFFLTCMLGPLLLEKESNTLKIQERQNATVDIKTTGQNCNPLQIHDIFST